MYATGERRHFHGGMLNRDTSAAHLDFYYLVSQFSGTELQKVKSNYSIEGPTSAD